MSYEPDEDDDAINTLAETAQLLNAMLSIAVGLYAKEANISEARAWKNVLSSAEVKTAVD